MILSIRTIRFSWPVRALSVLMIMSLTLSLIVLPPQVAQAQTIMSMPVPGTMVYPTNAYIPPILKGVTLHPNQPFHFDFIIDSGDSTLSEDELRAESDQLIKYFLASLAVPEDDMWVNLSPFERDKIIPNEFGITEMGRDLLAQDYLLKQFTASLMYPEDEVGRKFWDAVYKQAYQKYGTTNIPINTFNKVWIMPERAVIYEHENSAFVSESRLKVMLEEDFLALNHHMKQKLYGQETPTEEESKNVNNVTSEVVREILIPAIEHEVNHGAHFAKLRQIYNSLILATWYKETVKQSLLNQVYSDQNKVVGIDVEDKTIKDKIYQQYLDAFKKGVFDYIKEDYDPITDDVIPRKYFSGGMKIKPSIEITEDDYSKLTDEEGWLEVEARFDRTDAKIDLSDGEIEFARLSVQVNEELVGIIDSEFKPDGLQVTMYSNIADEGQYEFDINDKGNLRDILFTSKSKNKRKLAWDWIRNDQGQRTGLIVGQGRNHSHLGRGESKAKISGWIMSKIITKTGSTNYGFLRIGSKKNSDSDQLFAVTSSDHVGNTLPVRFENGMPIAIESPSGEIEFISVARDNELKIIDANNRQFRKSSLSDAMVFENMRNDESGFININYQKLLVDQGKNFIALLQDQGIFLFLDVFSNAKFKTYENPIRTKRGNLVAISLRERSDSDEASEASRHFSVIRDLRTYKPIVSQFRDVRLGTAELEGRDILIQGKFVNKDGFVKINSQKLYLGNRYIDQPVEVVRLAQQGVYLVDVLTSESSLIRVYDVETAEELTDKIDMKMLEEVLRKQNLSEYLDSLKKEQRSRLYRNITKNKKVRVFSARLEDLEFIQAEILNAIPLIVQSKQKWSENINAYLPSVRSDRVFRITKKVERKDLNAGLLPIDFILPNGKLLEAQIDLKIGSAIEDLEVTIHKKSNGQVDGFSFAKMKWNLKEGFLEKDQTSYFEWNGIKLVYKGRSQEEAIRNNGKPVIDLSRLTEKDPGKRTVQDTFVGRHSELNDHLGGLLNRISINQGRLFSTFVEIGVGGRAGGMTSEISPTFFEWNDFLKKRESLSVDADYKLIGIDNNTEIVYQAQQEVLRRGSNSPELSSHVELREGSFSELQQIVDEGKKIDVIRALNVLMHYQADQQAQNYFREIIASTLADDGLFVEGELGFKVIQQNNQDGVLRPVQFVFDYNFAHQDLYPAFDRWIKMVEESLPEESHYKIDAILPALREVVLEAVATARTEYPLLQTSQGRDNYPTFVEKFKRLLPESFVGSVQSNTNGYVIVDLGEMDFTKLTDDQKFNNWKNVEGVEVVQGGKIGTSESGVGILALVDQDGNDIGTTADRDQVHQDGLWHQTSHIYVFYKGKIILQKRSQQKTSSKGKLQVSVSGHVDAGETVKSTALREGEEELGFIFDESRVLLISEVNELKRSNVIAEGLNNEFTTIYYYELTDEEFAVVQESYNLNESDELWLLPTDTFEQMIQEDDDLFSNSLKHIFNVDKHLWNKLKEQNSSEVDKAVLAEEYQEKLESLGFAEVDFITERAGGETMIFSAFDETRDRYVVVKFDEYSHSLYDRMSIHNTPGIGVMAFYDKGMLETSEGLKEYIVVEFIEGLNMSQLLEIGADITLTESVSLLMELAQRVRFMHDLELIHGDIGYDNVMFDTEGHYVLIDPMQSPVNFKWDLMSIGQVVLSFLLKREEDDIFSSRIILDDDGEIIPISRSEIKELLIEMHEGEDLNNEFFERLATTFYKLQNTGIYSSEYFVQQASEETLAEADPNHYENIYEVIMDLEEVMNAYEIDVDEIEYAILTTTQKDEIKRLISEEESLVNIQNDFGAAVPLQTYKTIYRVRDPKSKLYDHIIKVVKDEERYHEELRFAKISMGGLIAPFTLLEDVIIDGRKEVLVVIQEQRYSNFNTGSLPQTFTTTNGEEIDLWSQEKYLIEEAVRRNILLSDSLIEKNYGINVDTGELVFIDHMDAEEGSLESMFPKPTNLDAYQSMYPRRAKWEREFIKGWTGSHLDEIGLKSDQELYEIWNTSEGERVHDVQIDLSRLTTLVIPVIQGATFNSTVNLITILRSRGLDNNIILKFSGENEIFNEHIRAETKRFKGVGIIHHDKFSEDRISGDMVYIKWHASGGRPVYDAEANEWGLSADWAKGAGAQKYSPAILGTLKSELRFKRDEAVIVIGNVWDKEIDVIVPAMKEYYDRIDLLINQGKLSKRPRIVLVPHDAPSEDLWVEQLDELLPNQYTIRREKKRPIYKRRINHNKSIVLNVTDGQLRNMFKFAADHSQESFPDDDHPGSFALVGNSFDDERSQGHNVIEAVSAGLPVIFGAGMTRNQIQADAVINNDAGAQVSSKDELVERMVQFTIDRKRIEKMKSQRSIVLEDLYKTSVEIFDPIIKVLKEEAQENDDSKLTNADVDLSQLQSIAIRESIHLSEIVEELENVYSEFIESVDNRNSEVHLILAKKIEKLVKELKVDLSNTEGLTTEEFIIKSTFAHYINNKINSVSFLAQINISQLSDDDFQILKRYAEESFIFLSDMFKSLAVIENFEFIDSDLFSNIINVEKLVNNLEKDDGKLSALLTEISIFEDFTFDKFLNYVGMSFKSVVNLDLRFDKYFTDYVGEDKPERLVIEDPRDGSFWVHMHLESGVVTAINVHIKAMEDGSFKIDKFMYQETDGFLDDVIVLAQQEQILSDEVSRMLARAKQLIERNANLMEALATPGFRADYILGIQENADIDFDVYQIIEKKEFEATNENGLVKAGVQAALLEKSQQDFRSQVVDEMNGYLLQVDNDESNDVKLTNESLLLKKMMDEGPLPIIEEVDKDFVDKIISRLSDGEEISDEEVKSVLSFAMTSTRKWLIDKLQADAKALGSEDDIFDNKFLYLAGKECQGTCIDATEQFTSELEDLLGNWIRISTFQAQNVFGSNQGHYFAIVQVRGSDQYYLVDPTLRQFFRDTSAGVMHGIGDELNWDMPEADVNQFLQFGYIALTDKILSSYANAFRAFSNNNRKDFVVKDFFEAFRLNESDDGKLTDDMTIDWFEDKANKDIIDDLVKNGLNYDEAKAFWILKRDHNIRMPSGFWGSAETARNMIFVALDSIEGFKEAREAGDVKAMVNLYTKHVIQYERKVKKKGLSNGQFAFFTEIGFLGGLFRNRNGYFNKASSPAELLRFTVPEMINLTNPDALDPLEVEHHYWTDVENAKYHILQVLDSVDGFKNARELGNIQRMAELYRENVINYKRVVKKANLHDGQFAFFQEVGGLSGLMNKEQKYFNKSNSPAELLRVAVPELIDLRNPKALNPLEVEHHYWTDPENAKYHILQALDSIEGFKEAREENNIKRMVELYRLNVMNYERKNVKSSRHNGQLAFFEEVGGLSGLMRTRLEYISKNSSPAELLRLAVPQMIDLRSPDAFDPLEVELHYWTNPENARYHILQVLDGIEGFKAAREAGDVNTMAKLYRTYVIAYKKKPDSIYRFNGQLTYFHEVGGLAGLMTSKNEIFKKSDSPWELLQFAISELVDPSKPDALKYSEVTYKKSEESDEGKLTDNAQVDEEINYAYLNQHYRNITTRDADKIIDSLGQYVSRLEQFVNSGKDFRINFEFTPPIKDHFVDQRYLHLEFFSKLDEKSNTTDQSIEKVGYLFEVVWDEGELILKNPMIESQRQIQNKMPSTLNKFLGSKMKGEVNHNLGVFVPLNELYNRGYITEKSFIDKIISVATEGVLTSQKYERNVNEPSFGFYYDADYNLVFEPRHVLAKYEYPSAETELYTMEQRYRLLGDKYTLVPANSSTVDKIFFKIIDYAEEVEPIDRSLESDSDSESDDGKLPSAGDLGLVTSDQSQETSDTKGGIDFTRRSLQLDIKRDGEGMPMPFTPVELQNLQINGLVPIIINITPVTNIPLLLGAVDDDSEPYAAGDSEPDLLSRRLDPIYDPFLESQLN